MHSSLKQEHLFNFSNTKVLEIGQIVLEKSWKSPGILSAKMCGSPAVGYNAILQVAHAE